ncbi:MAG: Planctomycete cytochrome [Verrucomicrobiaceae bacterium]|nr:Planctomycete cytochrome [Verrucomicrobiaceae bacterium]
MCPQVPSKRHLLAAVFRCRSLGAACALAAPGKVSYNFEVRPVLAAKCFSCHGSDAANRKGKLRLDDREAALAKKALVPGDPKASTLIDHIQSTDPDEVMPPPDKNQALTSDEKSMLARWITEGAAYEKHWAFEPPVKPQVPEVENTAGPIDSFVRAALARKGWHSAPAAERTEWLRRVFFALTGLPPRIEDLDAYLADTSNDADAVVVEHLLATPHFGERMAQDWLDAARYGDTYGRHEDADSEVWPWRNWVIKAFNDNLSYDRFIQWQTAGDMLPGATQDQIVATAFNRLPVMSNESGSDPEEFRWDQVFDRVKTNATAILGLTLECARCHNHKYDPLSQRDYYQFAAFFNNIDELGLFSRYTNGIPAPSTFVYRDNEQSHHHQLKQDIATAEAALATARAEAHQRYLVWLQTNTPPGDGPGLWAEVFTEGPARREAPSRQPLHYISFDIVNSQDKSYLADTDHGVKVKGLVSSEPMQGKVGKACTFLDDRNKKYEFPKIAGFKRTEPFSFSLWLKMSEVPDHAVIFHRSRAGLDATNRGYELTFENGLLTATLGHFYPGNAIRVQMKEKQAFKDWRHIGLTYDGSSRAGGLHLFIDGQQMETTTVRDHLYKDISYLQEWGDLDSGKVADAEAGDLLSFQIGGRTLDSGLRKAGIDELRIYDCELSRPEMARLAGVPFKSDWFDWYAREQDAACHEALARLSKARDAENDFSIKLRELMVMQECTGPRRSTPVLSRGVFSQPGENVEPETPSVLSSLPAGAPHNRLGLASWFTDSRNPLTSRVEVNRLWKQFFGRGLVATPEDFGLQGTVPSNPALLDWLAVHFQETGWNIKALCKEIALSETFRQSSLPSDPAYRQEDPDNLWLARGPRNRLAAEELRDAALTASGLLVPTLGGPSVRPYQPAGLWEDNGTQHVYEQDKGDNLHRRSLYTFWRRTCPPPVMSVFDAPTREFCRVKRDPTLTPLQALALENDTGFLEAARVMAEKLVRQWPSEDQSSERVRQAYRLLTAHTPDKVQADSMTSLVNEARTYYAGNPPDAERLMASTGEAPRLASLSPVEVAATLVMTRALLSSEPFLASY